MRISLWKNGSCPCFKCLLSSITRISSLIESLASFNKKMRFSSSIVITRLTGRNRTSKGENKSWLWSTTNLVTCHSRGKISNDFHKMILKWALHPHIKDFLFCCSLDGSTIFNGCLPCRWQKKSHLTISPFFFSQYNLFEL